MTFFGYSNFVTSFLTVFGALILLTILLGFAKVMRTRRRLRQPLLITSRHGHQSFHSARMLPSHRVNRADLFGIRALNAGIDGGVVQAKAIPRQASLMRQQRMLQGRRLDRPEKSHTHVDTFSERIPDKRWLDGNAVGFDPNHFTDLRDIGIFRDSNIAREAHVTQSSGIVRDSGTVTLQHPIPLVPKAPLLSLPSPDVPSELTPSIPSSSLSSTPVSSTSSSSPRLLSKVYSLPPPPRLPMAKVRRQRSRSWPAPLRFNRQSNPAPIDLWCEPGHESDTISAVESLWQGSGSSQESLTSVSALSEPYQFAPYRLAMSTATADAVRRTKDPVDVRSSRFGKNQHVSEVYAPYQSGFSGYQIPHSGIMGPNGALELTETQHMFPAFAS